MKMERINDRATKFISDVQKKKIKLGENVCPSNKGQVKSDVIHTSTSACNFCPKIFLNSSFLKKHIVRRHPGDLMLIHKSDYSNLVNKLEEGFLMLRNEISKHQSVTELNDLKVALQEREQTKTGENENHISKENENIDEIDSNELKDLKNKVNNMEVNIQGLNNKFEELNNVLQNEVLRKQDIEDLISVNNEKILTIQESKFDELRQILIKDLQAIFSSQLYEQNNEWKLIIAELKYDMKKLDCVIEDIKKQLDSPDYVNVLKEKLEREIYNFLDSSKRKSKREKISKTKYVSPKENKLGQSGRLVKRRVPSVKYDSLASSPKALASIVDEKLSDLKIKPNIPKISTAEFRDKLQLIDSEKACLNMTYSNFSEVYKEVTSEVDRKVQLKLENKKSKKIRFSDPLVSRDTELHASVSSNDDYQDSTLPYGQNVPLHGTSGKSRRISSEGHVASNLKNIPTSEEFNYDVQGGGDFLENFNKSWTHNTKKAVSLTSSSRPNAFTPTKDIKVSRKLEFDAGASTSDEIIDKIERGLEKMRQAQNHKKNVENRTESSIKDIDEPKNSMDSSEESDLQSLSSWEEGKLHSDD